MTANEMHSARDRCRLASFSRLSPSTVKYLYAGRARKKKKKQQHSCADGKLFPHPCTAQMFDSLGIIDDKSLRGGGVLLHCAYPLCVRRVIIECTRKPHSKNIKRISRYRFNSVRLNGVKITKYRPPIGVVPVPMII